MLGKRGRTLADLKASRDKGEPGRSFGTGVTVRLEVNGKHYPRVQGNNVIGGIRGRDPDLRNEVILVGAHLDHLGTDATGRVFNGADDNASGSATLLALAETLIHNRWRPARTIVFVWFGAEEQGLEGSRALVADLPFAHTAVVAMLNLDMTGRASPRSAGRRRGTRRLRSRRVRARAVRRDAHALPRRGQLRPLAVLRARHPRCSPTARATTPTTTRSGTMRPTSSPSASRPSAASSAPRS
jgi:hypothetical protein